MPNYGKPAHVPSSNTLWACESSTASVAERRRRRGEISCAECRRLKQRCDKKVPCKLCVRRGCGHLCPNGTNVTADGPRLVLAATNHLHENIAVLRDRIHALEGALGFMHHDRTGSMHPLLRPQPEDEWEDDLFRGVDFSVYGDEQMSPDHSGTLAAGTDGTTRFFGSIGDALVHMMSVADEPSLMCGEGSPGDDVKLIQYIRHFPFEPVSTPDHEYVLMHLRAHIPSREIYDPLLDIAYNECGGTFFSAFTPDYVEQSLIPAALYDEGLRSLNCLGCFFALLAMGCLFAVPGPGEPPEVRHFGRLSAVAMGAVGALAHPSLELIESLYARGILELFRQTTLEESARTTLTMACQMCYDLGLHMDGTCWRTFTAEELDRRRSVLRMVFMTDSFESISTGRPARMAFDSAYFDIEMPSMPSTSKSVDVHDEITRMAMLYAEISFAIQSLKPPAYSQILDLDERARAFFAGPDLITVKPAELPPPTMINIYLHRAFFARAITEHPDNPLDSEYSPSVHAALRGARETFMWLGTFLETNPASCSRQFHVWSIALAAATIYTTLLERAPHCPQAKDARPQFEDAIPLFVIGAKYGSARARHSLNVLCARIKKMPNLNQDAISDIQPYLSPSLRPESKFWPTVSNAVGLSSDNIVSPHTTTSVVSSAPSLPPARGLKRSASLSSIPAQFEPKSEQSSTATDDSFYPSYLRRRRFVPASLSPGFVELDATSSVPISRSLSRRIPRDLPFLDYQSGSNAAVWEGKGWETMEQTPLKRLPSSGNSMSPLENSLTCEWNVSLGGG